MKAQIVEGWPKGNKIRIVLSETNAAQVNGLRRAILSDVPKMAITKVRFEQGVTQDNKGEVIESVNVLPDEVIAHRLAMVPVPTFLDEFVFPEDDENNKNSVLVPSPQRPQGSKFWPPSPHLAEPKTNLQRNPIKSQPNNVTIDNK